MSRRSVISGEHAGQHVFHQPVDGGAQLALGLHVWPRHHLVSAMRGPPLHAGRRRFEVAAAGCAERQRELQAASVTRHATVGRTEMRLTSIDEPVILRVRANPEPHDAVTLFDPESATATIDANRPETIDLLEVQRGMPRIVTKPVVTLVREALDLLRQLPIATPEPGRRAMFHRSRVRPCRRSSRASSASASSRPADASCSNCVSHSAASNSTNHALNAASSSAES